MNIISHANIFNAEFRQIYEGLLGSFFGIKRFLSMRENLFDSFCCCYWFPPKSFTGQIAMNACSCSSQIKIETLQSYTNQCQKNGVKSNIMLELYDTKVFNIKQRIAFSIPLKQSLQAKYCFHGKVTAISLVTSIEPRRLFPFDSSPVKHSGRACKMAAYHHHKVDNFIH